MSLSPNPSLGQRCTRHCSSHLGFGLVLDDLHWADQPSLLLLEFLAREMGGSRLLVAGAYRDVELSRQHRLSQTLAQLSREPVFRREVLRGLRPPPEGREHAFFMGEVIRLLAEQGELREVAG